MAWQYRAWMIFGLISSLLCFAHTRQLDWLIDDITDVTTLTTTESGTLLLCNGLISREFQVSPNFATIDFYSHEKEQSILRALNPEAVIAIDGIVYTVGGLLSTQPRSYLNRTALKNETVVDPQSFRYLRHSTTTPKAPFKYTPMRGAPEDIQWPPKGLRLDVTMKPPFWAPYYHQDVTVTLHYEMYDGIPLMAKWFTVTPGPVATQAGLMVTVYSVEMLSVNQEWAKDRFVFHGDHHVWARRNSWLYVQTDSTINSVVVAWGTDPASGALPGAYEADVNVTYKLPPTVPLTSQGFRSFRVHELAVGSSDPERYSLAHHRLMRLLAPHTQESPLFFHMTNSSGPAVRHAVNQLSEVGFEMLIYSFWSGFDIESRNLTYVDGIKEQIQHAHDLGIEVGGYDLIAATRHVKFPWMAVNAQNQSIGDACFASGWSDTLRAQFLWFMRHTGLTAVETDGSYGGWPCYSTAHRHHAGYQDSVYWQTEIMSQFFRMLRDKAVFINQPDWYFYQGAQKAGIGYNENQFSLPRWEDIMISRQTIYDGTYRFPPTAGWMIVPLEQYHGGGKAAIFEPLEQHLQQFEWALAQYMGAGMSVSWRGDRIYDTNKTKELVIKYVTWFKKYRAILTSDIVHLRRPDLQGIDGFMHVNPRLAERGLLMLFNPTQTAQSMNLRVPLYYTGLSDAASFYHEDRPPPQIYILERDYSIILPLTMPAMNITWYVIR